MENKNSKAFWKNYLKYAIALAPAIVILIFLEVIRRTEPTTLLENTFLIIAAIAAFFAGTSATIAERSLRKTEEALRLTRATQRPFLNISRIYAQFHGDGVHPATVRYFLIGTENTGNYPADQVAITFNMCKTGEREKHKLTLQGQETPIYFPNVGNPNLMFAELDDGNKLIVNVGEHLTINVEINYRNKLSDTQHKTIRSYSAEYNPTAAHEPIPIPKKDYWD